MKKRITEKPFLFFWGAIPLILLAALVTGDDSIHFNIHDTYLVIAPFHLEIVLCFLFGILGFGYWVLISHHAKLTGWMTIAHVVLTFEALILIPILTLLFRDPAQGADHMYYNVNLQTVILIIGFLALLGQVVFLVNLVRAALTGRKD